MIEKKNKQLEVRLYEMKKQNEKKKNERLKARLYYTYFLIFSDVLKKH